MKAFVLDRYAKQGALRPADIPPPDLHDDEVLVAVMRAPRTFTTSSSRCRTGCW